MVRKFEFQKAYEEIEIDGKLHRFNTDEKSLLKCKESLLKHGKAMTELSEREDITEEEIHEKGLKLTRELINSIFNQDCFDDIYKAAGESLFNVLDLIDFLSSLIYEKVEERQKKTQQSQQKYFSSKRNKGKNKRK